MCSHQEMQGEEGGMFSQDAAWERSHLEQGLGKAKALLLFPSIPFSPFFLCPDGSLGVLGFHLSFPHQAQSPKLFLSPHCDAVMEQGSEDGSKRPIPAGLTLSAVIIFKNKIEVITNPRFSDPTSRLFLGWALHRGFCFGFLSRGRN